jgi:hypothetical protein
MFRLYGHPQVYHIYKNAKIILIIGLCILLRVYQLHLIIYLIYIKNDRLCGLVIRVLDYRSRGPGFDSRALKKVVGLERGQLSLVSTSEGYLIEK